jgi:S-adenosylmethionine/arginine decarboxylase-like enzyme
VYPSAPFYIIIYKYQGKNVSGFIIIKEVQLKSIYIIDNIYIKLLQSHVAIP